LTEESKFASTKKRYQIYHPERVDRKLAIVVGQKLPDSALQSFQLFTVSGRVNVELELVGEITSLSREVLDLILLFQTVTIPSVLQSEVSWAKLDKDSNDFLVVPVDRVGNLDLDFLKAVVRPPKKPSKNFRFEVSCSQQNLLIFFEFHHLPNSFIVCNSFNINAILTKIKER
jgi:hypothetical protein